MSSKSKMNKVLAELEGRNQGLLLRVHVLESTVDGYIRQLDVVKYTLQQREKHWQHLTKRCTFRACAWLLRWRDCL